MSRLTALSVIAILSVGLAACDSARETLGLNKRAPDEFAVVPRAPLVLPPNYDLRPPEPGAPPSLLDFALEKLAKRKRRKKIE